VESRQAPDPFSPPGPDLGELLTLVARGDQVAFETVYDRVAPAVFGLVLRVLRDTAQSEEVAQEALLEVWRTAGRFDPARGAGLAWVLPDPAGVAAVLVLASGLSADDAVGVTVEHVGLVHCCGDCWRDHHRRPAPTRGAGRT
jgi:Sigma-70 region 2